MCFEISSAPSAEPLSWTRVMYRRGSVAWNITHRGKNPPAVSCWSMLLKNHSSELVARMFVRGAHPN